MDWLTERLQQRNRRSRDAWQRYAGHRAAVMRVLSGLSPSGARICVLGAGNCNDLDLAQLAQTYREIHLVDLDEESLRAGVAHQGWARRAEVVLHGGVDVTGLAEIGPLSASPIEPLIEKASAGTPLKLPAPFDAVVSVCLLSQLVDALVQLVGGGQPQLLQLIRAVRLQHLKLLFELASPGGGVALVCDFVSSDTAPALTRISEPALTGELSRLIAQRNFFTGLNPFVLRALLHEHPDLSSLAADIRLLDPWRWDFGPRVYAVCALTARRL